MFIVRKLKEKDVEPTPFEELLFCTNADSANIVVDCTDLRSVNDGKVTQMYYILCE